MNIKKTYSNLSKTALLVLLIAITQVTFGQKEDRNFFDKMGRVRLQTHEINEATDTITIINHRYEDVAWSRTIYRIIDMREKQNFQLYFPTRPNENYKSLFRVMLEAVADGVNVYKRNPRDIMPDFDNVLSGEELSHTFAYDEYPENNLIQIDSITEETTINKDQYMRYIKNQLKFLVQEIIFFDTHTSRLYTKIIAIAPLYPLHPDNMVKNDTMAFFKNSVLCWFAFDELRPYLRQQNIIPNGNDMQQTTYDDFFAQKLYSSYILGDSNMYSRMLLELKLDPKVLKAEQKRIQDELMNFEQDLWEN